MTTRDTDMHYSMRLEWDPEDGIFVVTVPDLPGCQTHGRTYEEAVRQGQDAIASWLAASVADGEPVPPPRNALSPAGAA